MSRRFLTATLAAMLLVILTASAAMAGEVTGNGRKVMTIENSKWGTGLHARSVCAYSGQEDLQFFVDEETDSVRVENPVKGVPNHCTVVGSDPEGGPRYPESGRLQPW